MFDQSPQILTVFRSPGPDLQEQPFRSRFIGSDHMHQRIKFAPPSWEPIILEHRLEKFLPRLVFSCRDSLF